jgi:hypothetical protein
MTVITNNKDARFVVVDSKNNEVIGAGLGDEATIQLDVNDDQDINARVEFLDVISSLADVGTITIKAPRNIEFKIPKKKSGSLKSP